MIDQIGVFAIMIITVISYWLIFREKHTYCRVPKQIWTYWEEPDHLDPYKRMSDQAIRAIRSWKQFSPNFEVIILTKKTYQGYVTIPEHIRSHPDLQGEALPALIKLWILAERGGVWIDPERVIDRSLDPWLFPKYGEATLCTFKNNTHTNANHMIDPLIIAADQKSEFIKRWRDEFSSIAQFQNIDQYLKHRDHIDQRKIKDPIKNAIQIAALIVFESQHYPKESLIII